MQKETGDPIKQIVVIAEDRVGLIADISYILGKARLNIESLSAVAQGHKCIIDLAVKDDKKATELLMHNGYQVLQPDAIVVRIKDEPSQMSKFSSKLSDAKISLRALNLITKEGGYDTYALQVDHTAKAKRVLAEYLRKEND